MNISPPSGAADRVQTVNQTGKKKSLTQEDFINLIITQMRYQNPLDPMDNNQMATQMVQFGSLDALNTMRKSIENMTDYQASLSNLQAASLIGKKVEVEGGRIFINNGAVSESTYQLSKPGKVWVQIYDSGGNLIRVLDEGTKGMTSQKLVWDGKDQQGTSVLDGAYYFMISARDANGQTIPSSSHAIATITGITFENGMTYLNLGSEKITFGEVRAIYD